MKKCGCYFRQRTRHRQFNQFVCCYCVGSFALSQHILPLFLFPALPDVVSALGLAWGTLRHRPGLYVSGKGEENFLLRCQVPLESQVQPAHWSGCRDRDISPLNTNAKAGRKSPETPGTRQSCGSEMWPGCGRPSKSQASR